MGNRHVVQSITITLRSSVLSNILYKQKQKRRQRKSRSQIDSCNEPDNVQALGGYSAILRSQAPSTHARMHTRQQQAVRFRVTRNSILRMIRSVCDPVAQYINLALLYTPSTIQVWVLPNIGTKRVSSENRLRRRPHGQAVASPPCTWEISSSSRLVCSVPEARGEARRAHHSCTRKSETVIAKKESLLPDTSGTLQYLVMDRFFKVTRSSNRILQYLFINGREF